jgi:hypothetical protein
MILSRSSVAIQSPDRSAEMTLRAAAHVSVYLRFDFGFRFAWDRSDPATDRTVALLLVRRSFEALDASLLDVVIFQSCKM